MAPLTAESGGHVAEPGGVAFGDGVHRVPLGAEFLIAPTAQPVDRPERTVGGEPVPGSPGHDVLGVGATCGTERLLVRQVERRDRPARARVPRPLHRGVLDRHGVVSFAVTSRGELESAAAALTEAGIKHGEITDFTDAGLTILSFQDPDDINIELTAPLG